MQDLPAPKLGEVSAITITSPDLDKSLAFYQLLGFREVGRNSVPFPWIQVSDGTLLIMLRFYEKPFISLTYYSKNLAVIVPELKQAGIAFTSGPKENDVVKRYVFISPDAFPISLVSYADGFKKPDGHTALTFPQNDFFEPSKYPNSICGIFGEFAHPVKNLDQSVEFWKLLGFTSVSRYDHPYPWAIIADGISIVGLHQTRSFNNPVITYFAADQQQKVEALKQKGITGFSDRGLGSAVLTTPEQQYINLFKIGV